MEPYFENRNAFEISTSWSIISSTNCSDNSVSASGNMLPVLSASSLFTLVHYLVYASHRFFFNFLFWVSLASGHMDSCFPHMTTDKCHNYNASDNCRNTGVCLCPFSHRRSTWQKIPSCSRRSGQNSFNGCSTLLPLHVIAAAEELGSCQFIIPSCSSNLLHVLHHRRCTRYMPNPSYVSNVSSLAERLHSKDQSHSSTGYECRDLLQPYLR